MTYPSLCHGFFVAYVRLIHMFIIILHFQISSEFEYKDLSLFILYDHCLNNNQTKNKNDFKTI